MNAWLNEVHNLFVHFFGRATPHETYLVIALCILLGALILSRVGTALGSSAAFFSSGIFITGAGLALLIGAMALPRVFGLHASWMPLVVAVVVLTTVILPLTMLLQKGGYLAALIAWLITLLVVVFIITLEPVVARTLEKGIEKGHQLDRHRVDTEKYK